MDARRAAYVSLYILIYPETCFGIIIQKTILYVNDFSDNDKYMQF